MQSVFAEFKKLADRKKEIYDGDIASLIEMEILGATENEWALESYNVDVNFGQTPKISLTLNRGDEKKSVELSDGSGAIDAAFLAVEKITGIGLTCTEYSIRSTSLGHDAVGEVNLQAEYNGKTYRGRAATTDCVEASIIAILNATNRAIAANR